jgi:hypothetical protein
MQFNLAKDPSASTSLPSSPSSPSSPPASSPSHHAFPVNDIPLLQYQRYIVVHAVFCTLGFLVFLPAGVLLARYLRTFTPTWFQGHWIVQFAIGVSLLFPVVSFSLYTYSAGPFIVMGSVFGVLAVSKTRAHHLNDKHKVTGLAYSLGIPSNGIYHPSFGAPPFLFSTSCKLV